MASPLSDTTAVIVCVDHADILANTLPYNRHHFKEVYVVTAPKMVRNTLNGILVPVCTPDLQVAVAHECHTFITDSFYKYGAHFNKWLGLEEALDYVGRDKWLCLLDADIILPKEIPMSYPYFDFGNLYTPRRRMMLDYNTQLCTVCEGSGQVKENVVDPSHNLCNKCLGGCREIVIPSEDTWDKEYKLHRNSSEWAGYCQIFHGSDPVLEAGRYWHETNWKHAGGADSFFQRKWSAEKKIRPPFEVLHIGEAGANWCGRTSRYVSGEEPEASMENKQRLEEIKKLRRKNRGKVDPFQDEKIVEK